MNDDMYNTDIVRFVQIKFEDWFSELLILWQTNQYTCSCWRLMSFLSWMFNGQKKKRIIVYNHLGWKWNINYNSKEFYMQINYFKTFKEREWNI